MAMTMSISSAPARTLNLASSAFCSLVTAPSGKPQTVAISTPLPSSSLLHSATCCGLTHTALKLWARASAQRVTMSWGVAAALRSVWSMYGARFTPHSIVDGS